jgi:hypothetical protein
MQKLLLKYLQILTKSKHPEKGVYWKLPTSTDETGKGETNERKMDH